MEFIKKQTKKKKKVLRGTKEQKDGVVQYFDYNLLIVVIFLLCFGLIMLYSASSYSGQLKFADSMYFLRSQVKAIFLSILAMYCVSKINYHWYIKHSKKFYWASFILLGLVWSPIGVEAYGARRWIQIPFLGLQMQPAEVTKIAIILFIPALICRAGRRIKSIKEVLKILMLGILAAVCVLKLTDNLSSAIIILGICGGLLLFVYPKSKPIVIALAAVIIVVYAGIFMMKPTLIPILEGHIDDFRARRILFWLDPEGNASDGAFQFMQGLYAIGSGGLFGKGLGNSVQKTIIPEVQNDMILVIVCEELGAFGAVIMFVLFGMLLYRLLFIAKNAPDLYGSLIVTGIFLHIALQVILNVCVVIGVIPTTGISLPFISFGGTTILFLMIEMGIALGVSRRIKFDVK